ncbi:hypothetical protein EK904_012243 [Melospiza melodia maxima]|nr:hypothetical protein EK904_012243 [Melospiza melodia maxima]
MMLNIGMKVVQIYLKRIKIQKIKRGGYLLAIAVEQRLPLQHICPHLQHSCQWNGSPTYKRETHSKGCSNETSTPIEKTERSYCDECPMETQRGSKEKLGAFRNRGIVELE